MIGYYCQITTKALKYPNQKFLGIKQPLLRNYSCCKGMKLSFTCTDKYSQLEPQRSEALNKHSLLLVFQKEKKTFASTSEQANHICIWRQNHARKRIR